MQVQKAVKGGLQSHFCRTRSRGEGTQGVHRRDQHKEPILQARKTKDESSSKPLKSSRESVVQYSSADWGDPETRHGAPPLGTVFTEKEPLNKPFGACTSEGWPQQSSGGAVGRNAARKHSWTPVGTMREGGGGGVNRCAMAPDRSVSAFGWHPPMAQAWHTTAGRALRDAPEWRGSNHPAPRGEERPSR